MALKWGFTGTRKQPSHQQVSWLWSQLNDAEELHHGACVGADREAHVAALVKDVPIVVHPPTNKSLMAWECVGEGSFTVLPAESYLVRNCNIVDETDSLLALPDGIERDKSGTWFTVRYAVRMGKPVFICYPDGRTENR